MKSSIFFKNFQSIVTLFIFYYNQIYLDNSSVSFQYKNLHLITQFLKTPQKSQFSDANAFYFSVDEAYLNDAVGVEIFMKYIS